ncbi:MAG: DUF3365 domain-containing protein [Burkholderiales bacterium]|nr:DUF3365 domain-containing protein [Burkholderiales bacterium]
MFKLTLSHTRSSARQFFCLALLVLFSSTALLQARAADITQDDLANELAVLLRSARLVISNNQELINDAEKGDKGLAPDKVVAQAKENYKKAAGKELTKAADGSQLARAQKAMLAAISEVMAKNQALINEKGKGFKGFLPAVFARQVAENFSAKMNGEISVKLTAPKELIRNRLNRPDDWEHSTFVQQFKNPNYAKGQAYSQVVGGTFRFMIPEYYGATCLQCHGDPKGEKDITGALKEGSKLGDLAGAISLTIPKK